MKILLILMISCSLAVGEVITDTLEFDGYSRIYHVYIPPGYEAGLPLVFDLHGYGSHGLEEMEYTGMNSVADTANFVVVYPEALENKWNSGISDNPGYPTPDIDDVAFLSALIDTVHSDYEVNTDQVYSCGFSNGGRMSFRLAAEIPGHIRAVASVSGKLTETIANACDSSGTVPILYMHGTNDPISYYYGEQTGWYLPEDAVEFWIETNDCSVDGDTISIPNFVPSDGCTVDATIYPSYSDNADVCFLKINGGGHTWPGGTFLLPSLGNTCFEINASELIWNFFIGRLDEYLNGIVTSIEPNEKNAMTFHLNQNYPNPFNPTTTISYDLPMQSEVILTVYDMLGREVRTLKNQEQPSGHYEIQWNGVDASDNPVSTGVYFCRLETEQYTQTIKMAYLR